MSEDETTEELVENDEITPEEEAFIEGYESDYEETAKEEKDDIIQGQLECKKCNVSYEIEDGIPNLLPKKPSS